MFGLSTIRSINAQAAARFKEEQREREAKAAAPAQQKLARVKASLNAAARPSAG